MHYFLCSHYIHIFIVFVFTDVMGQVVDRSEIQDLNANNKPTEKIDFHLRDQQYKQSIFIYILI